MGDVVETINARLDEWEAAAKAATPGPWQWWNLEGADQGWSGQGPDLETVERGPVYSDGSQGAAHTVVSAWGHDAWGITVEETDAAHIALNDPAAVLAMVAGLRAVVALHTGDRDCGFACRNTTCPTLRAIAAMWPTPAPAQDGSGA